MYAIILDGSRQYRVQPGQEVILDFRADCELKQTVTLDQVLLVAGEGNPKIGSPVLSGATVTATVIGFPKVKTMTQKFRRRKASKRLKGHTQPHMRVKIDSIQA